jgi:hypothetical protein
LLHAKAHRAWVSMFELRNWSDREVGEGYLMFIWISKPWEVGKDTHWSHLKTVVHFDTYPWLPLCVMTGRRTRWRNLAPSKLINVKLPAQALLAFLLIIPVSGLILLKHDSLSNIPASLHTESNFSSAKDFNLLVSSYCYTELCPWDCELSD